MVYAKAPVVKRGSITSRFFIQGRHKSQTNPTKAIKMPERAVSPPQQPCRAISCVSTPPACMSTMTFPVEKRISLI
jgi:hypothetical protein